MNRSWAVPSILSAVMIAAAPAQDIPGTVEQNVVTVSASRDSTWEQHPLSLAPLVPAVFTVSRTGPTGHDLPVRYGVIPWTPDENALAVDKVRFIGDEVAAVACSAPHRQATTFLYTGGRYERPDWIHS